MVKVDYMLVSITRTGIGDWASVHFGSATLKHGTSNKKQNTLKFAWINEKFTHCFILFVLKMTTAFSHPKSSSSKQPLEISDDFLDSKECKQNEFLGY